MHIYYKYKVYLKDFEEELNREIECRSITELSNLAASIMATFKTNGKKMFYFTINDRVYECNEGLALQKNTNYHFSTYVALSRLNPSKFSLIYDYKEKYEFIIEKISEREDLTWRKAPIIVSGTGYGVIDGNKNLLYEYFNKEISFKDLKEKSENKKIYLLEDFTFKNDMAGFYNEYNKIRKKRIEVR